MALDTDENVPEDDVASIRKLILDAFTDRQLWRFCQEHKEFKELLDSISEDDSLDVMTDGVIVWCQKRDLFPELLLGIKDFNPRQYDKYLKRLAAGDGAPEEAVGPLSAWKDTVQQTARTVLDPSRTDSRLVRVLLVLAALVLALVCVIAIGIVLLVTRDGAPELSSEAATQTAAVEQIAVASTIFAELTSTAASAPTSPTPTRSPTPTHTPTATPTLTPSPSPSPSPTRTLTPTPTHTRTPPPTWTPTPSSTPAPITAIRWPGVRMVYVPAGKFTMGSLEGEADEQPRRTFALDAFWIDETEVTNAQYRQCVEDGVCRDPSTGNCSYGSTYRDPEKAEYPVACVSWNDAQAYAKWVGGRLPTEAEWEKAARGTDGWKYPWGNTFDGSRLNYCDKNCEWDHRDSRANDGYAQAGPVASYAQGASPYGVLDMAGNVGEWCSTIYRNYPYDPHDGRENLEVVESTRVWRGGYWGSMEGQVQGAERDKRIPGYRSAAIGFRIARDADEIYLPGPTATTTPTPIPAPTDTPTFTPTVPSPSPSPTPTVLPTPTPTPEAG